MKTILFSILMHRKSGIAVDLTVSSGAINVEQNQTYLLSDSQMGDDALASLANDLKALLVKHKVLVDEK
jgi:hypothetical protein